MIDGESVFDPEVMELMERLGARGIVLIVIDSKKNPCKIDYATAIVDQDLFQTVHKLNEIAGAMVSDVLSLIKKRRGKDGA